MDVVPTLELRVSWEGHEVGVMESCWGLWMGQAPGKTACKNRDATGLSKLCSLSSYRLPH